MAEAQRHGYRYGHPDWCNLGQGMPETGPLAGAPPRVDAVHIALDDQEYAPVPGIPELRQAVATMYNALYRAAVPSRPHRAAHTRASAAHRRHAARLPACA